MFRQVSNLSCSYAFEYLLCFVHSQGHDKENREQKPITKKLAGFHINQFALLTMVLVMFIFFLLLIVLFLLLLVKARPI